MYKRQYYYWSSTTSAYDTTYVWYVYMLGGQSGARPRTNGQHVWPVRAGQSGSFDNFEISLFKTNQTKCYDSAGKEITCAATGQDGELQKGAAWPSPRFVDYGDQTIGDNLTGLIWTKDGSAPTSGVCTGGKKTWQGALDYVACLNNNKFLGHNDWRLPNINELRSLVSVVQSDSASWLNTQGFSGVQSYYYWSSTTSAYDMVQAWVAHMWSGYAYYYDKSSSYYVLPVRAGGGSLDNLDILINNGNAYGITALVNLKFSAYDLNGVTEMIISNDASFNTAVAEPYATTKQWTLSSGDGTKTVYVKFKDSNGNWSETYSGTTTILDTTVPSLTLYTLPDKALTNNSTLNVTGTASDSNGIKTLTINGINITLNQEGTFSHALTLTAGANTITIITTDNAGNTATDTRTITLDTAPPSLTLSTLSNGSYTNNQTLNVAGSVSDNVAIEKLAVNNTEVIVKPDGSFSYAYTLTLGENIIATIARDTAGNEKSDTRTIVYDASSPVLVITTPADNSKTKIPSITLSGSIDEVSVMTVKLNDGSPNALDVSGNVFTNTVTLTSGINTIEVKATDRAGNTSSLKRTVAYDNVNPSVTVTEPAQDTIANQSNIIIKGEVSDTTSVIITIEFEGNTFTPVLMDGKFQQTITFSTPKTYQVNVKAVDELGNETTVQRNIIYALDTQSTLQLFSGWNFISFPKQPQNTAIGEVLKDVSLNVRVIWGYDNQNKTWKKFKPSATGNDLSAIEFGEGYWIYMNNPVTLFVAGQSASLQAVTLYKDWNLVGYGGQDNIMNLPANYIIIWGWENGIWKAKQPSTSGNLNVQPLDSLYRGKAYWIKMNENINWTQ